MSFCHVASEIENDSKKDAIPTSAELIVEHIKIIYNIVLIQEYLVLLL